MKILSLNKKKKYRKKKKALKIIVALKEAALIKYCRGTYKFKNNYHDKTFELGLVCPLCIIKHISY